MCVHVRLQYVLRDTVVWEISVFNNFRMLNFVRGQFRTTPFVRKFLKTKFYRLKIFEQLKLYENISRSKISQSM